MDTRMRITRAALFLAAAVLVAGLSPAQAAPKPWRTTAVTDCTTLPTVTIEVAFNLYRGSKLLVSPAGDQALWGVYCGPGVDTGSTTATTAGPAPTRVRATVHYMDTAIGGPGCFESFDMPLPGMATSNACTPNRSVTIFNQPVRQGN